LSDPRIRNPVRLVSPADSSYSAAAEGGAPERFSPILMTALPTGFALVPLLVYGDILGHEVELPAGGRDRRRARHLDDAEPVRRVADVPEALAAGTEGYDACLRFWQEMIDDPEGAFEPEDVLVSGDRATIRWRYQFGEGEESSVRGVTLMYVRDGKIVEALGYVKAGLRS
jgi:hypothetical protein